MNFGIVVKKPVFNLLAIVLVGLLSTCKQNELATQPARISAMPEGVLAIKKNWESCELKWNVVGGMSAHKESVRKAFEVFDNTDTYFSFTNASPADISLSFVSATQFKKTYSEGLLQYEVPTLTDINKTSAGTYEILLNQDYKWDAATMQYVVMHQIATILGISPNQSITQRFLPPNLTFSLSNDELATLKNWYPAPGLPSITIEKITVNGADVIRATSNDLLSVPRILTVGYCWDFDPKIPTIASNPKTFTVSSSNLTNNKWLLDLPLTNVGCVCGKPFTVKFFVTNNCGTVYSNAIGYTR